MVDIRDMKMINVELADGLKMTSAKQGWIIEEIASGQTILCHT